MKFIITTSNGRDHVLPLFIKYFEHHVINADGFDINQHEFELVGYDTPTVQLPAWLKFVSLGHQRGPKYFTDDLHQYFAKQPKWFVWMMDDSIIVDVNPIDFKFVFANEPFFEMASWDITAKCNLTNEAMRRKHHMSDGIFIVDEKSEYRLSTQPAIWNRDWLLANMPTLDGDGHSLTPWEFEKQPGKPGLIFGLVSGVFKVHEAIRKNDIKTILPIPEKCQLP